MNENILDALRACIELGEMESNGVRDAVIAERSALGFIRQHGPALEALLRERDELRAFAEGFRFTVTDSYYKDAYLTITRPDRSVHYRLSNSSDASDDIADIERRRVATLAQRDTSKGGG